MIRTLRAAFDTPTSGARAGGECEGPGAILSPHSSREPGGVGGWAVSLAPAGVR